jgi:hypothetical protein
MHRLFMTVVERRRIVFMTNLSILSIRSKDVPFKEKDGRPLEVSKGLIMTRGRVITRWRNYDRHLGVAKKVSVTTRQCITADNTHQQLGMQILWSCRWGWETSILPPPSPSYMCMVSILEHICAYICVACALIPAPVHFPLFPSYDACDAEQAWKSNPRSSCHVVCEVEWACQAKYVKWRMLSWVRVVKYVK